jgi:hypothetical protein
MQRSSSVKRGKPYYSLISRAVRIARRRESDLFAVSHQAQPAAFESDLARSLNNLSNQLSENGDRAGALRAIEEAVASYRRLAQAQPAAFELLSPRASTTSPSGSVTAAIVPVRCARSKRRRTRPALHPRCERCAPSETVSGFERPVGSIRAASMAIGEAF